jgi:hypothetical protein
MSPAGFEPAFPASEQPQTHVLDRAITGIGKVRVCVMKIRHLGFLRESMLQLLLQRGMGLMLIRI